MLRGEHTDYSQHAAAASGAGQPSESPSVLSRRRGGAGGGGTGAGPVLSDADPLFAGLGRGLSAASAEADRGNAAQHQRRIRVGEGGGSSNEHSDAEEDDNSSRPHISSERKQDAAALGAGNLASPLISPHAQASPPGGGGGAARRGGDSVLRRHIRVVNGDFSITPVERELALSHRSWFIRTFTTPTVDRTDLFRDNVIRSSRYTLWNFLPLNLWEQLTPWNKPANFYFLCIAFLQCITEISTTGGRPSILVPLVFVLTVTAIKDALEDYARHKQDRVKNQATYTVWRNGAWLRILSKNLLVGDLIRVKDGQRIPADLLLVSSGISNGTHAFVDTKVSDTICLSSLLPSLLFSESLLLPGKLSLGSCECCCCFSVDVFVISCKPDVPRLSLLLTTGSPHGAQASGGGAVWAQMSLFYTTQISEEPSQPYSTPDDLSLLLFFLQCHAASGSHPRCCSRCCSLSLLCLCSFRAPKELDGSASRATHCRDRFERMQWKLTSPCFLFVCLFRSESNLKPKQVALPFLSVAKKEWRNLSGLTIDLKTDVPNQVMSAWAGDVVVNSRRDNVSLTNFMLTDSVLRNSHWVVGLIVYTGEDQKIRMNMARELSNTRQKESSVFKLTKKLFIAMVVVQLVACLAAAFDAGKHQDDNRKHNAWYLVPSQTPLYFAFLRFFTCQWHNSLLNDGKSNVHADCSSIASLSCCCGVLLSGFIIVKDFIPISLYVSLEMVQFWQAIFIGWDKKMTLVRDGEEVSATAQSSKLNEQLAQVEYVFSDKTGTLTCNSMVFRKCIIDGELYGTGTTEAGRLRQRKLEQSERRHKRREQRKAEGLSARDIVEAEEKDAEEDADESLVVSADQAEFAAPEAEDEVRSAHVEFNQPQRILEALKGLPTLSQRLLGSSSSSSSSSAAKPSRAEMIQIFMYALALNNSVFPQPKRPEDDEEDANGQRKPSAALSPDAAKAQRKRLERQLSMSSGSGGVVRLNLADEEAEERARAEADHAMDPGDEVVLESSSPDERALVDFAQAMGYELIRRSTGRVELRSRQVNVQELFVKEPPTAPRTLDPSSYVIEPFEELCMLDFTSKRKRMTVLLRLLNPDGSPSSKVLVLIKGADSALKPYLTKSSSAEWDETYNRLGEMGSESLRTLLLGYAIQDFDWWNSELQSEYQEAQRRQGTNEKGHVEGECSSECRLCAAENAIEASAGFQILGASALEDLLSPQVPETLEKMLLAGIKVWMLTGDQLTTAQNIAISCNLLDAEMSNEGRLFTFDRNLDMPEAIDAALHKCTRRMDKLMAKHQAEGFGAVPVFGLCVHGDVFKTLQEEHAHHRKMIKQAGGAASPTPSTNSASSISAASQGSLLHRFFDLASKCRSVIACRLEPKEKADIVRLMKKRTSAVTMAVGDGNNDTPMIRASDIGVGIRGVEGTSAVSSSDYSIAEFRFLQRLLFVHGRLNLRRISTLILYVFCKLHSEASRRASNSLCFPRLNAGEVFARSRTHSVVRFGALPFSRQIQLPCVDSVPVRHVLRILGQLHVPGLGCAAAQRRLHCIPHSGVRRV